MNVSSLFLVVRVITEVTKKIILYAQWKGTIHLLRRVVVPVIQPFLCCREELGFILSSCGDPI